MAVYRVECAHRTTGVSYPVIVEALSARDAADFCVAQGHLVGRVLTEVPHYPVGGTGGSGVNGGGTSAGAGMSGSAGVAGHPYANAGLGGGAMGAASAGVQAVEGDVPRPLPLSTPDIEMLRELTDRVARLQRSGLVSRPITTIAGGIGLAMLGLALAAALVSVVVLVVKEAGRPMRPAANAPVGQPAPTSPAGGAAGAAGGPGGAGATPTVQAD